MSTLPQKGTFFNLRVIFMSSFLKVALMYLDITQLLLRSEKIFSYQIQMAGVF